MSSVSNVNGSSGSSSSFNIDPLDPYAVEGGIEQGMAAGLNAALDGTDGSNGSDDSTTSATGAGSTSNTTNATSTAGINQQSDETQAEIAAANLKSEVDAYNLQQSNVKSGWNRLNKVLGHLNDR